MGFIFGVTLIASASHFFSFKVQETVASLTVMSIVSQSHNNTVFCSVSTAIILSNVFGGNPVLFV